MEKIKAAVIGLGRIASLLEDDTLREKPCTHTGAITTNEDCVLVAGCDIDEERRKLFVEKWNNFLPRMQPKVASQTNTNEYEQVRVYSDAKEMISVHKPQILSIATHPDSHYEYCRLAAEMGVPVVICEKPLADNIGEAKKIAKLAQNKKPIIITNHERRYSQDYIRAKDILQEAKLGTLVAIRAVLYMGKTTRLIDQFWHDGTHLADAIMFLTDGILKHKRSWGAKLNSRSGTAWLEGELRIFTTNATKGCFTNQHEQNPVPVIIEVGASRDHLVFEIEFSCEKGRLRIGNGVFEVSESIPSPYAEKFRSLKNTGENFTSPTGYFANMLKDAVACVKDPERQPVSGAADGLRVIEYLNSVKAWR